MCVDVGMPGGACKSLHGTLVADPADAGDSQHSIREEAIQGSLPRPPEQCSVCTAASGSATSGLVCSGSECGDVGILGGAGKSLPGTLVDDPADVGVSQHPIHEDDIHGSLPRPPEQNSVDTTPLVLILLAIIATTLVGWLSTAQLNGAMNSDGHLGVSPSRALGRDSSGSSIVGWLPTDTSSEVGRHPTVQVNGISCSSGR